MQLQEITKLLRAQTDDVNVKRAEFGKIGSGEIVIARTDEAPLLVANERNLELQEA